MGWAGETWPVSQALGHVTRDKPTGRPTASRALGVWWGDAPGWGELGVKPRSFAIASLSPASSSPQRGGVMRKAAGGPCERARGEGDILSP